MLGAVLGYLQYAVSLIHYPLVYTAYLVAYHKQVAFAGFPSEGGEGLTAVHLLQHAYLPSLLLHPFHFLKGILHMPPLHTLFRS